ncbi:MarR family winged helix-turn-helix transcriptional regulator [Magnetococcus sp. PR-3]|uniref:MarR family winged helix-turn-helix transcriptional regulator n=1 Tax=Magnetococcus sp. PR-3 TaxID=3120355 RepID=UPI002FCE2A6B
MNKEHPHAPHRYLNYTLKQAQHALRKKLDRQLRPLGLTVPQFGALAFLDFSPGLSNAQLARDTFVTPQSMQGILVNLEKAGYIARHPHPEHGRILRVELTEQGKAVLTQAFSICDEVESKLRQAVYPLSYEEALSMLQRCRDVLEE